MSKRLIPFTHRVLEEIVTKDDLVVDATAGNGHDTAFLAKHAAHVFAFDVQDEALKSTRTRLEKENLANVTLIRDSHENIPLHIYKDIKAAVFNLGYLPGGDKTLTTKALTSVQAVSNMLELLVKGGVVAVTVYLGHSEGKNEADALMRFADTLSEETYRVSVYKILNRNEAPFTMFIEKLK